MGGRVHPCRPNGTILKPRARNARNRPTGVCLFVNLKEEIAYTKIRAYIDLEGSRFDDSAPV